MKKISYSLVFNRKKKLNKKDCYNSLDFKPVKTKGLKIAAQLQKGASGGVIEWKVN